jgi:hypothetical protein
MDKQLQNLKSSITSREFGDLTKFCKTIPLKLEIVGKQIVLTNSLEEKYTIAVKAGSWWESEAGPLCIMIDRLLLEIRQEMIEENMYFNNKDRDQILLKSLEQILKCNDILRSERI